ncbi:hypothetical protein [Microviridae sp.]|nr:hypothetical protein [Microviridae sp.]
MFRLQRVSSSLEGTFGVLLFGDMPICLTLELPWKDNEKNVSCIPDGKYTVARYISPRHGSCLKLFGVPGRSDILFHVGNTINDTEGCILVGQSYYNGGILNSRIAFAHLMQLFPLGQHAIEIRSC